MTSTMSGISPDSPFNKCLDEVISSVIWPNNTDEKMTKVRVKCRGFLVVIPVVAASQHVLCVCIFPRLKADIFDRHARL